MNTDTKPTLQSVTQTIQSLKGKLAEEERNHARAMGSIRNEIQEQEFNLSCLSGGLDPERIAAGKAIVEVKGEPTTAERERVVADACIEIAARGGKLATYYFGTKNYARWSDQRTDCNYGMGPRHGTIGFSVGLTRENRGRDVVLSPDQIDAALYYLHNLSLISGGAVHP